jgi:hypothetical protein
MFGQIRTKATDGHFAPRHTNTYCISPDIMTTAQDGGKVVSLTHWLPLPPRKYTWYSFLLEAESTPGP